MKKILSSVVIVLGGIAAWKLFAKNPAGAAKGVHNGLSATSNGADTLGVFFHDLGGTTTLIVIAIAVVFFLRK